MITLMACPAMAVPCGFDQFGRPVGLQLVGKPRGEAVLLQSAILFEQLLSRPASAARFDAGHRAADDLNRIRWRCRTG
jgi:Asp-tRNA(Asn)/Glu-tRNA(Gln) amidotransferase A subunit family amidase